LITIAYNRYIQDLLDQASHLDGIIWDVFSTGCHRVEERALTIEKKGSP